MSGQSEDARVERARLGGTIGGPRTQARLKAEGRGWFNSETQARLGAMGAKINQKNQTGAWDPENEKQLQETRWPLIQKSIFLKNLKT